MEDHLPETRVCDNCLSPGGSDDFKSHLIGRSGVVTIREAIVLMFTPGWDQSGKDESVWNLCVACGDILTELFNLYSQFLDLCQPNSPISRTRTRTSGNSSHLPSAPLPSDSDQVERWCSDSSVEIPYNHDAERLRRMALRQRQLVPQEVVIKVEPVDYGRFKKESPYQSHASVDYVLDDDWRPRDVHQSKKRKRGRPKKSSNDSTNRKVRLCGTDSLNLLEETQTEPGMPVERKRGRPRKITIDSEPKKNPDSVNFNLLEEPEMAGAHAERKRGRPKKATKESSDEQNGPNGSPADPVDLLQEPGTSCEDRRRGRPLKFSRTLTPAEVKSAEIKQGVYECPHCRKHLIGSTYLHKHIRTVHQGQRAFCCPVCSKKFSGKDGMTQHLQVTHADSKDCDKVRKYFCQEPGCGKSFLYSSSLRAHGFVHNRDARIFKFQCPQCGRKQRSNHDLQYHIARHSDVRNVVCDACGGAFKTKKCLSKHKRLMHPEISGGYPIAERTCSFCQKVFTCPMNMRQHIRGVHHLIKAYQCTFCEKRFSCSSNLKVHVRGMHGNQKEIITHIPAAPNPDDNFSLLQALSTTSSSS